MARKKPTPLATALLAIDCLSPEETATLVDYLRNKLATPRKKAAKKDQPTLTDVSKEKATA